MQARSCVEFSVAEDPLSDYAHALEATERTPLRYPGGKTRAVPLLLSLVPSGTTKLCAPFFGGGSFELACASRGIQVSGYDIFTPLVEFWQCLLDDPEELAEEVAVYYPLARDEFYALQKSQSSLKSKFERAAAFYVLNRASFSGATLSGGMSPDHPRFTPSSIERIENFYNPNVSVMQADFHDSISKHPDTLLYCDPPYMIDNHLYGTRGDTHRGFDHAGLATLLKQRDHWILSYNNIPEIHELYRGYKMFYPKWKYGMSTDKHSSEVLIVSDDLRNTLIS